AHRINSLIVWSTELFVGGFSLKDSFLNSKLIDIFLRGNESITVCGLIMYSIRFGDLRNFNSRELSYLLLPLIILRMLFSACLKNSKKFRGILSYADNLIE